MRESKRSGVTVIKQPVLANSRQKSPAVMTIKKKKKKDKRRPNEGKRELEDLLTEDER